MCLHTVYIIKVEFSNFFKEHYSKQRSNFQELYNFASVKTRSTVILRIESFAETRNI